MFVIKNVKLILSIILQRMSQRIQQKVAKNSFVSSQLNKQKQQLKVKIHKRSYSGQQFTQTVKAKNSQNLNTCKLQRSVYLVETKLQKQNQHTAYKKLFCRTPRSLAIKSCLFFKPNIRVNIQYGFRHQENQNSMIKSHKPKSEKNTIFVSFNQNKLVIQKNGIKHFQETRQFINYAWIQILLNSDYSIKNLEVIQKQQSNKIFNLSFKDIDELQQIQQSKVFKPLQLIEQGNRLRALKFQSSQKKKINWAVQLKQPATDCHNYVNQSQKEFSEQDQKNLKSCDNKMNIGSNKTINIGSNKTMNIGSNVKSKIFKNQQKDIKRKLTFDILAKPQKTRLKSYFQQNNISLQKPKQRFGSNFDKQNMAKCQKLAEKIEVKTINISLNERGRKSNSNGLFLNEHKKTQGSGYMQKSVQLTKTNKWKPFIF